MIRHLLRVVWKMVRFTLGAAVAGVLGWCWVGWSTGTPNAPMAMYSTPAEPPPGPPLHSHEAWRQALQPTTADALEARMRELYWLSQAATPEERRELRDALNQQGDKLLAMLVEADDQSKDYAAGSIYVANVLRTWMTGDHAGCLAAIEQLPPMLQSKIPTRLLKAGTLIDGRLAMQMLGPSVLKLIPPDGLDVTLYAWAQQDVNSALAFAQQQTTEKNRQQALEGVLGVLAETDPTRCLQVLAGISANAQKQLAQHAAKYLSGKNLLANYDQLRAMGAAERVFPVLGNLAATDPAAAQRWLEAHPSVWENKGMDNNGYYESRPEGLANLLGQALATGQGNAEVAQRHLISTINWWSFTSTPSTVESWLATQTDPAVRAPALRGLLPAAAQYSPPAQPLAYWIEAQRLDPAAAADYDCTYWMQELFHQIPEDELAQYHSVLATLTPVQQAALFQQSPALFQPPEALNLTLQIQDFSDRQTQEAILIRQFARSEPAAVQAWIQQLPTAEEQAAAQAQVQALTRP